MNSWLASTLLVSAGLVSACLPPLADAQEPQRMTTATQQVQRGKAARAQEQDVPYVYPQRSPASVAPKRAATQTRTATRVTTQPGTTTAMAMAGDRHDLPFFAQDLPAGRRNYVGKEIHSASGSQKWGYDIGQMHYDSGSKTWSEVKATTNWSDPRNSDFYVYGQPVYAMGPGKVIRCWRNAPENPRPFSSALGDKFDEDFEDRDWLHQQWRNKRMSGGGNHLLVEEADGDWILYAHAQTGSIPASLCPHNQQLYSAADQDSEADVPSAQQATIQAGQLLYKVGNSGNSSAPHLHVHQQDEDANPVQFRFRRGMSSNVTAGNKANIDGWNSFKDQGIPSGPVLFWPPTRLGPEYARHGFSASSFQRLFDHLADSGFWLEWIDGYSVGGKTYLNHVWRPAQGAWRAFFLISPQKYQAEIDKALADGYSPLQVESSLVDGQVRYSVIFRKGIAGKWLARHGLTAAQHDQVMNEATGGGMRPAGSSVVSVGGSRYYTDLYRAWDSGAWQLKTQVEEKDYQVLYEENAQAGRRPAYVNAYMHGGKPYISVIFAQKPDGQRKDRHMMSKDQYQQEFDSAVQTGMLTRAVSAFDGAQSGHRYIAIWRK
ncbi:MAG TPA: hypothetical protein VI566_15765 [Xanthomonadales bacterium]|nr:hypothetical protein [Xanthomonadales bacterium]